VPCDDAGVLLGGRKYKLSEVLVFRNLQTSFRACAFDDGLIVCTGHPLSDRDDAVSSQSQINHYRNITILICDKRTTRTLPGNAQYDFFTRKRIRRVS
jgi:hypothetical protein